MVFCFCTRACMLIIFFEHPECTLDALREATIRLEKQIHEEEVCADRWNNNYYVLRINDYHALQ